MLNKLMDTILIFISGAMFGYIWMAHAYGLLP